MIQKDNTNDKVLQIHVIYNISKGREKIERTKHYKFGIICRNLSEREREKERERENPEDKIL